MSLHDQDPFSDISARPVVERGPWLATASGGMWSIHHPAPRDVYIQDVAAGLSRACRYNGQIIEDCEFLSVAEHSVLMTRWAIDNGAVLLREDALAILLHDGSEAYLGDMATPLKALLPEFRRIENAAQDAVMEGFGLNAQNVTIRKELIKLIDLRIRLDERDRAIGEPARSAGKAIDWDDDPSLGALKVDIAGLNPRAARQRFLETFIWCVENLPLRNPVNSDLHDRHAAQARETLSKMKPEKEEVSHPDCYYLYS